MLKRAVVLAVTVFAVCAWAGEDPVAGLYAKEATWAKTMLGARARYLEWRQKDPAREGLAFGPWHTTGPLKSKEFAEALFPEKEVNLDAKDPTGKPLWFKHEGWVDGAVHQLPGDASVATYLFRTIQAGKPAVFTAGFGSDDGIEVWLNGAKVLSKNEPRGGGPDADIVDLNLAAGENRLLMKVFNQGGWHAFYFSRARDPLAALCQRVEADFPTESGWMKRDNPMNAHFRWFCDAGSPDIEKSMIGRVIQQTVPPADSLKQELDALCQAAAPATDLRWLDLYVKACWFERGMAELSRVNLAALRRGVEDLSKTFPEKYIKGSELLARLNDLEKRLPEIQKTLTDGGDPALKLSEELRGLQREALAANPLLAFDKLLVVKRGAGNLGLPQNWQGNCAMGKVGYDNEIDVFSPLSPDGKLATFFRPEKGEFAGDVDLNFDADKMLFSMPGSNDRWQIWEIKADGTGLRQVTPGDEPDVDNYDACYLPDGRITFGSTRCFQGVPCVGGSNTVANLCRMDADGKNTRQLCFDQDHNWCPTVMNDGRLLYTRWEYSDTPHYFSRLLFRMNPDGTGQAEYNHSNSYWPNSTFYARPIPGHATAVVAIASGHHGVARMGELIIFDPGQGRHEADSAVQRIPGYGKKVEPIIMDTLVDAVWPKFLHPYPLSDKYFLVSCKPNADALWGIYLVDIFDNMLLLCEVPGYALLEPVPFRATPRPPIVPDRVRLDRQEASVYLADIYAGQGLKGVPHGTVKKLRLYEFHYSYPQMGGHINVGVEGPWDVHRILGTVPVEDDGSAFFKVPSNMPIAVQPLDAEGRALQLMRSWFVGMPGETVSCVGCHERQNMTPPSAQTMATRHAPVNITPWHGPARGFSFKRDVQPVLDTYCVGCHDASGKAAPDLSAKDKNGWSNFTPSYLELHPYVRRPGPESDYHILTPLEFHASTRELVQMLDKGHQGVKLDADARERLFTWIDLNVPDHGTWGEHHAIPGNFHERRMEMRTRYANRPEDPEAIPDLKREPVAFVQPEPVKPPEPAKVDCPNWPFDAKEAQKKQNAAGAQVRQTLDLGDGVTLDLMLVPAGEFVMGSNDGPLDERPLTRVRIDAPFWMATTEITNRQFQRFDPNHDNGFLDQHHKDHTTRGYSMQAPNMPAVRLTWEEAMGFGRWLSEKTGRACALPTEAQWEWACRAGTDTPCYYGDLDTDFAAFANLADLSIKRFAVEGVNPQPIANPSRWQDFIPKEGRFDDKAMMLTDVGQYQPNPWGLYDMHGNVAEWTLSTLRPYPYSSADGREDPNTPGKRVVRGGSWRDRPENARSAYRLAYEPWQPVYNVGFRVVCAAQ